MLQELRNQTQSLGFKVLAGAIIVVLTLFGFGATNLFLASDPTIAAIGDYEITETVLERETERERRKLLFQVGEDFDPNSIDRLKLREYALEQLITKEVLFQTAENLNIRTSKALVDQRLLDNPAYQKNGLFDEPTYLQQVQMLGYSPIQFVNEYGRSLSAELLRTGIASSSFTSDWEVEEAIKLLTQKRDVAYLLFGLEKFKEGVEVSEAEIKERYDEELDLYMTDTSLELEYLGLSVESLTSDASLEISEEDIVGAWKDGQDEAIENAQRASSHILVSIDADRTEPEALEAVNSIYQDLSEGADFEVLAKELSDDAGSSRAGGSLGLAGRGVFAPEFEEALWSLEKEGSISQPVKTEFGYHIIRLDSLQEVDYPGLEESRGDLIATLKEELARELFAEKMLELERLSYDERYSLSETAKELKGSVVVANDITMDNQGEHNEWLSDLDLLDSLFEEAAVVGENGPMFEIGDDKAVVVRVVSRSEPEPIAIEEVSENIQESIRNEKAEIAILEAKAVAFNKLIEGVSVTEVASENGLRWSVHELAGRTGNQEIPQEILNVAFELPRPAELEKSVGEVSLANGTAIVTVTRVQDGDPMALPDEELAQIKEGLKTRNDRVSLNSFFIAAQSEVGLERN